MKRLWACALLLAPTLLWGQTAPSEAFTLRIQAPDEARELLERHLELQRYRVLPDLSDSELERLLLQAREDARKLLATLGYFSPDIVLERTPGAPNAQRNLLLRVNPGKPTQVGEVEISFAGPIAAPDNSDHDPSAAELREQIRAAWPLQQGMRFSQEAWSQAKQSTLLKLSARRYPQGALQSSLADVDPEHYQADLQLTLDSGAAYKLGPLRISGAERYPPQWAQNLAQLQAGSEYDRAALVAAQRRLADSGYYDSAYVSLDSEGDPAAAPVLVQVREAPLQKLVLGVGVSTDNGARFSAEHTQRRLPFIPWRAVSKLALDRNTQSLGTELTAPPSEDLWRWVGSALFQNERIGSFDVGSQRLRAGRGQTSERLDQNYYLQYEQAGGVASDNSGPLLAESVSANYAFTLRRFDSIPFPSSGWGLGMEIGAGMTLGSQQQPYSRVLSRLQAYIPLGGRDDGTRDGRSGRIAVRASLGAVVVNNDGSVPSTQLFLAGGDTSVRGYAKDAIGVGLPGEKITAGRYLAVGSIEWQRPIILNQRPSDWEGVLFVDSGAVANRFEELSAKVGVGTGVRWKSPVGPLQMDLAYGIADKSVRLHLNVGFNF